VTSCLTEHMAGAASMDENWFGPAELVPYVSG